MTYVRLTVYRTMTAVKVIDTKLTVNRNENINVFRCQAIAKMTSSETCVRVTVIAVQVIITDVKVSAKHISN